MFRLTTPRQRENTGFRFAGFVLWWSLFLVASMAGGGCAGGGANNTATQPARQLRSLQPGDRWSYTLQVNQTAPFRINTTGTLTVEMIPVRQGTEAYLMENSIATGLGSPETSNLFYRQESVSRDLTLYGTDAGLYSQPVVTVPGLWEDGLAFTRHFEIGSFVMNGLFRVERREKAITPVGTFWTWRTYIAKTSDSAATTGTYWYAPEVGRYVQAAFTTVFTGGERAGQTVTYTAILSSTSVPLSP